MSSETTCLRHGKPILRGDAFADAYISHRGKEGAVCVDCATYIPSAPESTGSGERRRRTVPTYMCQGCGTFTHNSKAWVEVHPCPTCRRKHYWTGSFTWPPPTDRRGAVPGGGGEGGGPYTEAEQARQALHELGRMAEAHHHHHPDEAYNAADARATIAAFISRADSREVRLAPTDTQGRGPGDARERTLIKRIIDIRNRDTQGNPLGELAKLAWLCEEIDKLAAVVDD